MQLLSIEERSKADRFHFSKDRNLYLVSHAMLRLVLARYVKQSPWQISYLKNTFGKPYLPGNPLHFNLSHSGESVIIAICKEAPIGVDIEQNKPNTEYVSLLKSIFTVEEQNQIATFKGDEQYQAFLNAWTRKESFIKAVGKGLSISLTSFEVPVFENEGAVNLKAIDSESFGRNWIVKTLDVGNGYTASFCHPDSIVHCIREDWNSTNMDALLESYRNF